MNIAGLVNNATAFSIQAGIVEARLRGSSCSSYVVTLTAEMYDALKSELQSQHRMISRTAGFAGEHFMLDGNIIVREVK
jgi:uncharacterized Zn finger protein